MIKLILPTPPSPLLKKMIQAALGDCEYETIRVLDSLTNLKNQKILFAIELNQIGINNMLNAILEKLSEMGKDSLSFSRGAVLIYSKYNTFTKTAGADIVYLANKLGCEFPGRPCIEANAN